MTNEFSEILKEALAGINKPLEKAKADLNNTVLEASKAIHELTEKGERRAKAATGIRRRRFHNLLADFLRGEKIANETDRILPTSNRRLPNADGQIG